MEGISIHALHEESDLSNGDPTKLTEFQSTLSMRRATQYHYGQTVNLSISIHALHEESDLAFAALSPRAVAFQSTLSMRRATLVSA